MPFLPFELVFLDVFGCDDLDGESFPKASNQAFLTSWFRTTWKKKIKNPCRELVTQNNHWKSMVTSSTAKKAKTQVVPSNILQPNALLASVITRVATFIGLRLILLCNLIITIISTIKLASIMAAPGATTLI